jgi:L-threonylcarbamoyladenylate synthase
MPIIDTQSAVQLLKAGELVAIPTDTVYGLAADLNNPATIQKIYDFKDRSRQKPLLILISSSAQLSLYAREIIPKHRLLIEKYWPGALSLIFQKTSAVSDLLTAGQSTIGLRQPNHPSALEIISQMGGAIVATSVNKSGGPSLNTPQEIQQEFPELAIVQDQQKILKQASSVLDLTTTPPRLFREGTVTQKQLEETIQESILTIS